MTGRLLLAVETSCDETAVALLDYSSPLDRLPRRADALRADLIASQVALHLPYGGVVPEIAAREHLQALPALLSEALRRAGGNAADIGAIAATRGPGLKGCLLVGLSFAKALASSLEVPLLALNHMEGHFYAGELNEENLPLDLPALALVVSGGHTMLVLQERFREYRIIARTRDDAAGEAFDKSATLLGLPYPGGPALSALAATGDPGRYPLPIGMPKDMTSFSFSGLKTAVSRLVDRFAPAGPGLEEVRDIAAAVETAIVEALVRKSIDAIDVHRPRTFILTGGVAANRRLRARLTEELGRRGLPFLVPPLRWCTDNAAMMAVLGARIIEREPERYRKDGWSQDELGPGVPLAVSALARWPLDEVNR